MPPTLVTSAQDTTPDGGATGTVVAGDVVGTLVVVVGFELPPLLLLPPVDGGEVEGPAVTGVPAAAATDEFAEGLVDGAALRRANSSAAS